METVIVPPGGLVTCGTVARIVIVVTIFGGKRTTTMKGKRVTSSSYKVTQKRILHNSGNRQTDDDPAKNKLGNVFF